MKTTVIRITKTLDEIQFDMSQLYDELRDGKRDLKVAAELANIAGKNLKAEQLKLMREVFMAGMSRGANGARTIPGKRATVTNHRRVSA